MGPKKGSPKKESKGSPGKSKGSPDKKKSSPDKKGKKGEPDVPEDEEEIIVEVPHGIMHHRMRFLLKNEIKTDIEFIVGPPHAAVNIKAHKCVLAAESPVFETYFSNIDAGLTTAAALAAEQELLDKQNGKKGSPDKKNSKEKKGSPDKKKGSPDKNKGSPDKNKGSPDKKKSSPDKKKGSKGSPDKKSKGGSKDKTPSGELPVLDFPEDELLNDKEIAVYDVHPDGFYKILRYIYHDEIVYNGVVGVLRTMYAARKYMLPILYKACVEYLENNVTIEHVLKLLLASLNFHEDKLKALCMELIINETFEIINRLEFASVDHRIIDLILEQDILNCREIELYDRVMNWAENECERIGIMISAKNQRVALGPLSFAKIRFPAMIAHEFATHVVPSGCLRTDDEVVPILSYYITGRPPALTYSCVIRRRPCLKLDKLETESVAFSDDTDVTFVGYAGYPRRVHSFKDLTVPIPQFPTPRQATLGLIARNYHTISIPDRLHCTEEEWEAVDYNITHLKKIYEETERFEFAKKNLVLIRRHYK